MSSTPEERRYARALRRARRQARRRERRSTRREDLVLLLEPLVRAAEVLIVAGADRLVWVVDQFTDLVDIPGIDEEELDELVEGAVELLVSRLFPD